MLVRTFGNTFPSATVSYNHGQTSASQSESSAAIPVVSLTSQKQICGRVVEVKRTEEWGGGSWGWTMTGLTREEGANRASVSDCMHLEVRARGHWLCRVRQLTPVLFAMSVPTLARNAHQHLFIVQELCESRGGRSGLSVLTSLLVSVDVKNY